MFLVKKIVGQTVSSTNSTVTKTKESFDDTEQETLIKIGKMTVHYIQMTR